jgi:hypothetical protein
MTPRIVQRLREPAAGLRDGIESVRSRLGVDAEHGVLQPGACAQGQERCERSQSQKRTAATCHRYRFAASAS